MSTSATVRRAMHLAQLQPADDLLGRDSLALLLGMMLDQQVPMEKAFRGPYDLARRLGGELDATAIAGLDTDRLIEHFLGPPALHRFPAAMARRAQALCQLLVDRYDGDATAVWSATDATVVLRRLQELPGFGPSKARIFLALLGKQYGVRPRGWRAAAGPVGAANVYLSVADIVDGSSLALVRAAKKEQKAAARAAAGAGAAKAAASS